MHPRRIAGAGASFVVLLTLMAGCGLFASPKLSVNPTSILMVSNTASFTVSNTGANGTVLTYDATSTNPSVTVSPASGSIDAGSSTVLTLAVSPTSLTPGDNVAATVTLSSNGGASSVRVNYGIGTCGTYTPQYVAGLGPAGVVNGTAVAPRALHAPPAPATQDIVPGEIIVGYNPPSGVTGAALRTQALERQGMAVRRAFGLRLLAAGNGEGPDLVSAADVPATLAKLRADPRVRYAQRNLRLHRLATIPNDPYYPLGNVSYPAGQWNLRDFGLPNAWDVTTGSSSRPIVIAVIDDGVQPDHPDFKNVSNISKVLQGYDFIGADQYASPGPHQDHGTHVAGIAAAIGNNGTGIAGVAYDFNVKILPVKVFSDSGGGGTVYDLANAIRWAAGLPVSAAQPNVNPNPADVINMSLGVEGDQPALDAAASDAWNHGSLLVAAAGNHGPNAPGFPTDPGILSPANAPCVIAVGSVDDPYTVSSFSNTGPQLEVTAPGGFYDPQLQSGEIVSTYPGSTYGVESGTSMASPFVAGVAALLKAHDPSMTPTALRQALDGSALHTAAMTDRSQYGYGVVCADKALGAGTTCGK